MIRWENWTFRASAVRLWEHGELRRTLQPVRAPDYTTLYQIMMRLDENAIHQALEETARRLGTVGHRRRRRARVAGSAQATFGTFLCAGNTILHSSHA